MIRLVQRKLIIPRGDTGNFSLPVPKEANTGDVAVFTIIDPRTNTKVYEKITEPVEQLITIVFTHNDTVNLPVGRYLWDVKFYVNPTFADEKLVNGDEVDSYYAAYTLPECEVRQTGDDLMTSDDSPSSTLTPESLNIITAAITEATQAKNAAAASAAEAQGYVEQITGLSAEAETLPAGASATAAYDAETGVLTLGLPRGDAFSVAKTYPTIVAMNADYSSSDTSVGDFVMIVSTIGDPDNAKLYVKGAERFEFVVDMSGANGVGVQSIVKSGTVENVDTYTITYTDGTTTTYNVVNGVDGDEYTVMVQDTQPTQETNKLWIPIQAGVVQEVPTVQEMQEALSGKADKVDTVLETSLSRGRKEGTEVGNGSFAFGNNVEASGWYSHAEGSNTAAINVSSHAEGAYTRTIGAYSHAEGGSTQAFGVYSHAEGNQTLAIGETSHVEGFQVMLTNMSLITGIKNATQYSITRPNALMKDCYIVVDNQVRRIISVDVDNSTITVDKTFSNPLDNKNCDILMGAAEGKGSHAEGSGSISRGQSSHVVGTFNNIDDSTFPNWSKNTHYYIGDKVVRNNTVYQCIAENTDATFISSNWTNFCFKNTKFVEIVGNGTPFTRSNARALDWEGNEYLAGDVYVGANADSTGGTKLAKITDIPSAPVQDVQVNGVSVLDAQGMANVPVASANNLGAVKVGLNNGTQIINGVVTLATATSTEIKSGNSSYKALNPGKTADITFYGLAKAAGDTTQSQSSNAVGMYTESAKSAISQMLNAPETVSGSTPSITAKAGVQYVCGEVSTLDIILPASGIVDVVFTSGSTPTVLTVTPPTGVTVKWANGFDQTALEANTTYEIRILNGQFATATAWN